MKRFLLAAVLVLFSVFSPLFAGERYEMMTKEAGDSGHLTFYFIDLRKPTSTDDKSGDATLVVSPDGKTMLIDCGHPDCADDVVGLLKALDIKEINVFVNSHPHIDHLGGFPKVAAVCKIDQVYRNRLEYNTLYTRAFNDTIKKQGIPVAYLAEGDSFKLGGEVTVNVFAPKVGEFTYPNGYPANATGFINNSSIAMQICYGDSKALFCGDLYRGGEQAVLEGHASELKSDLAKANHHGGDTSNILKWVKAVQPQVVVAMNDLVNSIPVIDSYKKRGATFYHTALNGLVKVTLDKDHHVEVLTEKDSWVEQK